MNIIWSFQSSKLGLTSQFGSEWFEAAQKCGNNSITLGWAFVQLRIILWSNVDPMDFENWSIFHCVDQFFIFIFTPERSNEIPNVNNS